MGLYFVMEDWCGDWVFWGGSGRGWLSRVLYFRVLPGTGCSLTDNYGCDLLCRVVADSGDVVVGSKVFNFYLQNAYR